MKKNNRQLNQAYDQRVRPKQPVYDFAPLEQVIRQWVLKHE